MKAKNAPSVTEVWHALSHRAAAVVGSLTGLVSLLGDVPVGVASLRGALAWLAALLLGRATAWLLVRTARGPATSATEARESS